MCLILSSLFAPSGARATSAAYAVRPEQHRDRHQCCNRTANGGQYIEVLPDVAFGAYFADCSPDLNNALSFLQGSTSPPGTCVYN